MIELNEEHVAILSSKLHANYLTGLPKDFMAGLPEDFIQLVQLYSHKDVEGLDEFLVTDGKFRFDRAGRRMIVMASHIGAQDNYYRGRNGWGIHLKKTWAGNTNDLSYLIQL